MLFFILGYFLPFYLPNSPKNQNLEKKKKTPGDIIILHMCTKNHDPMVHLSWNIVCDGCNYFSFWAISCPFTPLTAQKIKIFTKCKKLPGDIIILHKCPKNYDQMMYGSWDMVHDSCNWYFSFSAIFCIFTPLTAQKTQILKKWKKLLEISSFYICVPKIKIRWSMVPEIRCTTDRWTDGRTEKVIYKRWPT